MGHARSTVSWPPPDGYYPSGSTRRVKSSGVQIEQAVG